MATKKQKHVEFTAEQINAASVVLASLTVRGEYAHMKGHVEEILGGMLLPYQVKKGDIKKNAPGVADLIKKHSKTEVKKRLAPEPKIVEKMIEVEKVVVVGENTGKFRRIRTENKISRMKRTLGPIDRDVIIRWWNTNQRLIDKNDPVCNVLAEQINATQPGNEPLCALQVAGYFSVLCRIALYIDDKRKEHALSWVNKGMCTVEPLFTQPLLDAVKENWEKNQRDEAQRRLDHEELIRRRAAGDNKPIKYIG